MISSIPFPIEQLAANGLKRGMTTGTCATAAVKAALLQLLCNEMCAEVRVTLPDGIHFVTVPIAVVESDDNSVYASVVKDGGDDPDQTHRATITARVRRNNSGVIRFCKGNGVGLVTQPGLLVPVGEPAINPVPRQMMHQAVHEVLDESDVHDQGFDLEIGCENGETIARRTFNPRLGVVGGISILGTTGIVEPKSLASFKASIEVYIRVALAENPTEIVLAPGNLGQRFARTMLDLPTKRIVQMSNFIGFSIDFVRETLLANHQILPCLWLIGHPGKLAKILDDVWDTHSSKSTNAVNVIWHIADEFDFSTSLLEQIKLSTTVEGIIEILREEPKSLLFWSEVEQRIKKAVWEKLKNVSELKVRIFEMDGKALSM